MTLDQIFRNRIMPKARDRVDRSIAMNFRQGGRPEKWKPSQRALRTGSGKTLIDTGILVNSINTRIATESKLIASTPTKYAKAHNDGFSGTVSVKSHNRLIRQAFGRPIEPKEINIKAHQRNMNLPKREFMMLQTSDVEYFSKMIQQELSNELF